MEPSPWSQPATQLLVALTWAVPGCGTPTQMAAQLTSPDAHLDRHDWTGVCEAVMDGAPLLLDDCAAARPARALRATMMNCMVSGGGRVSELSDADWARLGWSKSPD